MKLIKAMIVTRSLSCRADCDSRTSLPICERRVR